MQYQELLFLFMFFYAIFIILLFPISTPRSDEGTYLLLGLFYNDLIKFVLKHGVSNVYDFAIDYLVHYPKLSIYYPPLYHGLISLGFFFVKSEFVGRFITLIFSLGCIFLTYKIGSFLFDPRTGFVSSILLAVSRIIMSLSREVLMDIPLFFFFLLSFWFCLLAFRTNKKRYYILFGMSLGMGFLVKWPSILSVPIMLVYLLIQKKLSFKQKFQVIKNLFISFIVFAVMILPYVLVAYKLDVPELIWKATILAGFREREPQLNTISGWLYYPRKLFEQLSIPLASLSVLSLVYFLSKKHKHRDLLITWILTVYLIFTITINKNVRYTILYLPPILFTVPHFLGRIFTRKMFSMFLVILVVFQVYASYDSLNKTRNPIKRVAEYVYENSDGNVAFISENDEFYTSAFMFYLNVMDRERRIRVFRPCVFEEKSEDDIQRFLENNNIHYLVLIEDAKFSENFEKIKNISLEDRIGPAKIYALNDFTRKEGRKCNYICLTKETVCSDFEGSAH